MSILPKFETQAELRGTRALMVADAVITALNGQGLLRGDLNLATRIALSAAIDALYGNLPVDIPTLR